MSSEARANDSFHLKPVILMKTVTLRNKLKACASSDHQSIYIGVPVPRGYRRKRRRRRSSREASGTDRNRHYSQHSQHEDSRYRDVDVDVDVEEGLTDSNEQGLHVLNHSGKSRAVRSPVKLRPSRLSREAVSQQTRT